MRAVNDRSAAVRALVPIVGLPEASVGHLRSDGDPQGP